MDNFIYKPKWFSEATPTNPHYAMTLLGSGDDGVITITSDTLGTEGNDYSITVSDAGESGCDLSVSMSGKDITVVLGKTLTELEDTKNTAILIASAIDELSGVSAVASGTGATSITAAVTKTSFTRGSYGTPCPEVNTLLYIGTTYYVCTKQGNEKEVAWKSFTLSAY